jgi:hypothetical protein
LQATNSFAAVFYLTALIYAIGGTCYLAMASGDRKIREYYGLAIGVGDAGTDDGLDKVTSENVSAAQTAAVGYGFDGDSREVRRLRSRQRTCGDYSYSYDPDSELTGISWAAVEKPGRLVDEADADCHHIGEEAEGGEEEHSTDATALGPRAQIDPETGE